jgi:ABC transporter with metal-binding/Fe-S-binding domain ATP-binding protein
MKLGVLFSGGKDSTLVLHIAAEHETVACLITLRSKNPESYMFHTPNIDLTSLQAEALQLPLITRTTEGRKEEELDDLRDAVTDAVSQFQIDGLVTGAVESVYQSTRIQCMCHQLNLWCFNPIWKHHQTYLLEELIAKQFKVIVSGIFAYPLDETWLGRELDRDMIGSLTKLEKEFGISPSGEGGEIETTVLDAPMFGRRIEILQHSIEAKGNSGVYHVNEATLVPK